MPVGRAALGSGRVISAAGEQAPQQVLPSNSSFSQMLRMSSASVSSAAAPASPISSSMVVSELVFWWGRNQASWLVRDSIFDSSLPFILQERIWGKASSAQPLLQLSNVSVKREDS